MIAFPTIAGRDGGGLLVEEDLAVHVDRLLVSAIGSKRDDVHHREARLHLLIHARNVGFIALLLPAVARPVDTSPMYL